MGEKGGGRGAREVKATATGRSWAGRIHLIVARRLLLAMLSRFIVVGLYRVSFLSKNNPHSLPLINS